VHLVDLEGGGQRRKGGEERLRSTITDSATDGYAVKSKAQQRTFGPRNRPAAGGRVDPQQCKGRAAADR